jgi:hypothetical protein
MLSKMELKNTSEGIACLASLGWLVPSRATVFTGEALTMEVHDHV